MFFIFVNLFLLLCIFFLLLILSMVWPPDSPWSPWWKTDRNVSYEICTLAKVGKDDIFYELGSGNGTTLICAVKEFGVKKAVGIEIDPLRAFLSMVFKKIHKVSNKITIHRKNFFHVNLSEATIVYTYLVPRALKNLEKKFLKELKPGTRIVSFVYTIDYLPLVAKDEKRQLYVYQIPSAKSKGLRAKR